MKTIIAGSRGVHHFSDVARAVKNCGFEITEVVSGGARGADLLGERWAKENGVPIKQFIPDWEGLGKSAGFVRNAEMADYADALIAVWDGFSRGTAHMIADARNKGLKVVVINLDDEL